MRICAALIMRNIILQHFSIVKLEDSYNNNNKNDHLKALDHHSILSLDSFGNSISMLQSCDFDSSFVEKRKLNDHLDQLNVISPNHSCKSQVSTSQESPKSYKRRKIGGESKEKVVTKLMDDGFVWRKYGQKKIHDYDHPRRMIVVSSNGRTELYRKRQSGRHR
ncbi:hypothetical protein RND81_05G020900 [Saponaria officinalis]|uniref:WRKY domain-containing protein n=1 Tax=Saponaria officinalis TaxID=3572 RepID=A0AAW1KWU5_SAPOF